MVLICDILSCKHFGYAVCSSTGKHGFTCMAHDVEDGLVESLAVCTYLLHTDVVFHVPKAKGAVMAWREVDGEGVGKRWLREGGM